MSPERAQALLEEPWDGCSCSGGPDELAGTLKPLSPALTGVKPLALGVRRNVLTDHFKTLGLRARRPKSTRLRFGTN